MDTEIELGFHNDIPESIYHHSPGISKSQLMELAKSPAHYKWMIDHPGDREPTPAMIFGTCFHLMILEPGRFDQEVISAPEGMKFTTKEGKAWKEENKGKIILKSDEMERLKLMREEILAHPTAARIFEDGTPEVSAFWRDQEVGSLCRARFDYLREDGMIADLKTTDCAAPDAFARTIFSDLTRYYVQAAYYSDAYEAITGEIPKGFIFVAVEKSPPYPVATYILSENGLRAGRDWYRRMLDLYEECREADIWPGYDGDIGTIEPPSWFIG